MSPANLFSYFDIQTKGIVSSLERQAKFYEVHAQKVVETPFEFVEPKLVINLIIRRISDRNDLERLFHSYLLVKGSCKESKKDFQILITRIDLAHNLLKPSEESQEKY